MDWCGRWRTAWVRMSNTLSPVLGGSVDLDHLSPKSLGRVSGRTSSQLHGGDVLAEDGVRDHGNPRHLVRDPTRPCMGSVGVTAAALLQVPYYAVITSMYAGQGAPVAGWIQGLAPFCLWPLIAFVLGLVGLRRVRTSAAG
jgi:hypothetical protein